MAIGIGAAMATWVKKWQVKSTSSKNKTYTVAQDEDGNYGCSCPAWTRMRRECKHIRMVQAGIFETEIEGETSAASSQEAESKAPEQRVGLLERLRREAPWRMS